MPRYKLAQQKQNAFQILSESVANDEDQVVEETIDPFELEIQLEKYKQKHRKKEEKPESIEEEKEKESKNSSNIIADNPLVYEELIPFVFMFLDYSNLLKASSVCRLWHSLLSTSNAVAKKNAERFKLASCGLFRRATGDNLYISSSEHSEEALFDQLQLQQCSFWFTMFERDFGRHPFILMINGSLLSKERKSKMKQRIEKGTINVLQFTKKYYHKMYISTKTMQIRGLFEKYNACSKVLVEKLEKITSSEEFAVFKSCQHKYFSYDEQMYGLQCSKCQYKCGKVVWGGLSGVIRCGRLNLKLFFKETLEERELVFTPASLHNLNLRRAEKRA